MGLDALVATPTGWVRNGDLSIGDEVLTPFGTVTTVTGIYPQGVRPVYEVKLRDGSKAESCNEHLWQIENGQTSEIINTDELKSRIDGGRQINLPRIEPLAYTNKILDLDPYEMGVNLSNTRTIHDKFIPKAYLYSSVEQRIDLLRGLGVVDGYDGGFNEIDYVTDSEQLAKDAQTLIRSLGGRVRMYEDNKSYRLRHDNSGNRVVSVTYVRDEETQCISVADERHLYVTNDYLPTHNTENIVFLKSTDDGMIDTLVKMSGTTHETRIDQKTITKDNEKFFNKTEGKISYTMATKEKPVIGFNDFMFIKERNSIIIKAGTSPLWNHNETAYPMSWRLFANQIKIPGKKFSLQTIPTNSSAIDFDVRKNQPDFFNMLNQRLAQAKLTDEYKQAYLDSYNLTETDIIRLDQNVVADELMHAINGKLFNIHHKGSGEGAPTAEEQEAMPKFDEFGEPIVDDDSGDGFVDVLDTAEENTEMIKEAAGSMSLQDDHERGRYAGGHISRAHLVSMGGAVTRSLDNVLAVAYEESKNYFEDGVDFRVDAETGELRSANGVMYIRSTKGDNKQDIKQLEDGESDVDMRVYSEDAQLKETVYEVTDEFIKYLSTLDSWKHIAGGHFETEAKYAYEKIKM